MKISRCINWADFSRLDASKDAKIYRRRAYGFDSRAATDAFVTPNYLGALFKKWTGSSFSEYLNTVRLRHACELLATTELSVKEIAFSSCYRSVEHFCFTFQKTLLCTPKSFRQKLREEKID